MCKSITYYNELNNSIKRAQNLNEFVNRYKKEIFSNKKRPTLSSNNTTLKQIPPHAIIMMGTLFKKINFKQERNNTHAKIGSCNYCDGNSDQ